jgi:hypothetical protein
MKVRELIKALENLAQDTDIWVYYDHVEFIEPTIDVVDQEDSESKQGDYYFMAW